MIDEREGRTILLCSSPLTELNPIWYGVRASSSVFSKVSTPVFSSHAACFTCPVIYANANKAPDTKHFGVTVLPCYSVTVLQCYSVTAMQTRCIKYNNAHNAFVTSNSRDDMQDSRALSSIYSASYPLTGPST